MKGTIDKELDGLESLGIITKVTQAEWAASIVAIPKADGSVYICDWIWENLPSTYTHFYCFKKHQFETFSK